MFDLFEGRTDAWGGDEGRAIWQSVTLELIQAHLEGTTPIGVYTIQQRANEDDPLMVHWGCCDIDTGDWAEAYRLGVALDAMGLEPWIERSRSKGWHLWVFVDGWVEAWEMRRALKVAYSAIGLPAKEANPKSEKLRVSQLGNYVRLPYKGFLQGHTERQTFVQGFDRHSDGQPLPLQEFLAEKKGVDPGAIKKWAAKWFEPPRKHHVSAETLLEDDALRVLASRMLPQTYSVWHDGPRTADRSATLQALGHAFAKQGFTPKECYQLVAAADRMWGKYHQRVDGEGYIVDIVERCYI